MCRQPSVVNDPAQNQPLVMTDVWEPFLCKFHTFCCLHLEATNQPVRARLWLNPAAFSASHRTLSIILIRFCVLGGVDVCPLL